jgi:hypothetical protein
MTENLERPAGRDGLRATFKTAVCAAVASWACATPTAAAAASLFNQPGNILITDQFNNRTIEVTRGGKIVWSFGSGGPDQCTAGPGTMIAPNDAERLAGGLTLLTGTGTGSCPDNRVIVVNEAGTIVYQYGQAGVAGEGPDQLNVPVFAIQTPDGDYLITDQANNRIIKVDANQNIVYQYGPKHGIGALNSPNSAEVLPNGDILIADESGNRTFEIDPSQDNKIVFSYRKGLNTVAFSSRLPNGDTLIADAGHNRIVEINAAKQVVFNYHTNLGAKSNPSPQCTGAVRLADGNTLIADQFNNRAIIISPQKHIIFQYGETNVIGEGPNQLNAPYSAVSIGDYTGVTPPPGL